MNTPTHTSSRIAPVSVRPATGTGGSDAGPASRPPITAGSAQAADRHRSDTDLERAVRQAAVMRRGFYLVVLVVALAGQVTGAVQALHIPPLWAIPAVAALELGGVVVLANADVRRRLGERATGSRLLSAAIAAAAVAFNWAAHPQPLVGGFFAVMSALGYLVWLTHAENSRRDRLRSHGALPPTTPAYEPVGHWLRHPWLTRRARSLARANPHLGLYESVAAARAELDAQRRNTKIATVLHRKIRAAVDPTVADLAIAVYNLDEIAHRLAAHADYDGLTDLIAADIKPSRLTASPPQPHHPDDISASHIAHRSEPHSIDTPVHEVDTQPAGAPHHHTEADATPSEPPPASQAIADHARPSANSTHQDQYPDAVQQPFAPREPTDTEANLDPPTTPTANMTTPASMPDPGQGSIVHGVAYDSDEPDAVPHDTAAAVAYWRQREPHLNLADIAARIGRSQRTVYRYWT